MWLLGIAILLVSHLHAAGDMAVKARLTGVSTKTDGKVTTVVIETTEPVAYVTTQPDPLTVLVDLRNVSVAGSARAAEKLTGPVADVSVDAAVADDGTAIARVRLSLSRPATPTVRSRWNTVIVEFGGTAAVAQQPRSTPVPAVVPASKPSTLSPAAPVAATQPARAAAPGDAVATLTGIDTATGAEGTRVTFVSTGSLKAATVEPARDLPPRLVVDLPRVLSNMPAVTAVGKGPIEKIRVAVNSRQPLVTRIVIDLKYPVSHRVESADGALVLLLDAAVPAAPAAPAPAVTVPPPAQATESAPPAVASSTVDRTTPTPAAAPAPSTSSPPRPDTPALVVVSPGATAAAKEEPKSEPKADRPADVKPQEQRPGTPAPALVPPAAAPAQAAPVAALPQPAMASGDQSPAPPRSGRQYTGHLVSFDFQQADLRAVLRTFAEISGLNVIIDPSINGTVDVSLREVPWDQALEIILRANKLGYVTENNVVRIAPLTVLAEEESQRQKLSEAQAMGGQLKVLTKSLSYAKASEMGMLLVKSALSQRGQVQVDPRTNTLIITDLPSALVIAEDLINSLDRPEPQVEIEARIVQTTRDSARALGVQWGLSGRMAPELGNTSPLTFPNQGSVSGRTGSTQGNPVGPTRAIVPGAVNLPATGATSAIGIAMGSLNGALNLDVALSALEKKGNGRILSSPRVMMQNNVEAELTQGIQIPLQTVANNTVTVTFKDAALVLKVKPQITAANTVIMDVSIENAAADFSKSVNGIPPINTQRARTQVLVNDNETTVIGGIVVSQEQSANDKVPGMWRIPLLGWLFKRDASTTEDRELLIFITPRIRR